MVLVVVVVALVAVVSAPASKRAVLWLLDVVLAVGAVAVVELGS